MSEQDNVARRVGNYQGVGVLGEDIVVLMPARRMTREEALVHAAYIVALATTRNKAEFDRILTEVENT